VNKVRAAVELNASFLAKEKKRGKQEVLALQSNRFTNKSFSIQAARITLNVFLHDRSPHIFAKLADNQVCKSAVYKAILQQERKYRYKLAKPTLWKILVAHV